MIMQNHYCKWFSFSSIMPSSWHNYAQQFVAFYIWCYNDFILTFNHCILAILSKLWSAALEGQELEESVMAMMPVKILTVLRQKTAFTLLYSAKCLIYDSHSISHRAEACLWFLVLPKVSIYSHQFLISILTYVGKVCLPIVYLQTKKTFCYGLCFCCTLQSVEEHLAWALFCVSGVPDNFEASQKSFLTLLRSFPREMSIWRKGLSSPKKTGSIAVLLEVSLSQALCMNFHYYVVLL